MNPYQLGQEAYKNQKNRVPIQDKSLTDLLNEKGWDNTSEYCKDWLKGWDYEHQQYCKSLNF